MKPPLRRKEQAALPDYRKASLSAENEGDDAQSHFIAVCHRQDEIGKLSAIFSKLEPPAEIDGRKLSPLDIKAYTLAVNYARGTSSDSTEFPEAVAAQTKKASVRFFKICTAAMDAVKRERESAWNETDGHRMAALQAKLELERNSGTLPTQMQVKERAFHIVSLFIKSHRQDFAPMEPGAKRWSKILSSVGLDYLHAGGRGKGKRK